MSSRFTMIVAVHLLLYKNGKVLLARRYNTGYEDGNFSVPAGHVEEGESCLEAMIREAKEEVNIEIMLPNLTLAHVMHRNTDRESVDFFFVCKEWKGVPVVNEKDKCDKIEWFFVNELPPNTIGYIRQAIGFWQAAQSYSELGF